MKSLFQHRWLSTLLTCMFAALLMILIQGEIDLLVLGIVFLLAFLLFSYPFLLERSWNSRHLPPDTIYIPIERIRRGNEYALLELFNLPPIYNGIKNRYALKMGDAAAPGLFLYFYLPPQLYESRNVGPETVTRHLASRLKQDTGDASDLDLIAQRLLPLVFGYRFLPKEGFRYAELSKVISVVKKDYFRENTKIRGVLQSRKRMFRVHSPDDNDWRTFFPYQEDSRMLYGGITLAHDFRSANLKKVNLNKVSEIDAERIEYPESIPFGSLLTYAKKGEIHLEGAPPDALDKLYIDRVNVLVYGTEHRREILQSLSKQLQRELFEEDIYPLFNYGQRLRAYVEAGRSVSDYVSSHGNFALYYDSEKGWTILPLEERLKLLLQEAYWSREPRPVRGPVSLTTSRATLVSGSEDASLTFQISTGTPTRGQIFAADEMIEDKVKSFAQSHSLDLLSQIGTGGEGCLYLARKNSKRFYIKSPDGQLAAEEVNTIEALKHLDLVPRNISTFPEERIILLPEFPGLPRNLNSHSNAAISLLSMYLKNVFDSGYLCLDLTPDHVRMAPEEKKIFLIDFAGYVPVEEFIRQPRELLADRKKIEYRTPEESMSDFQNPEKFQIYLAGLLFYQLLHRDYGLPLALKDLGNGSGNYQVRLAEDVQNLRAEKVPLAQMLAFRPEDRIDFGRLLQAFALNPVEYEHFWEHMRS